MLAIAGFKYKGAWAGWYNKYSLIALIFIFLAGQGLNVPNSSALSLAPFARQAGSASALLGCMRMGAGALASAAVSVLHNQTVIPMVSVMAFCAIIALVILQIGKKQIRATAQPTEEVNTDVLETETPLSIKK